MSALSVVFVVAAGGAGLLALMQAAHAARTAAALARCATTDDDARAARSAYSRTCVGMVVVGLGYVVAAVVVLDALVPGVVIGLLAAVLDHRLNRVLRPQRRAAEPLVRAAREGATSRGASAS